MEDKRAQTLQALSTFIDKQRALLTRTHADIDRLNELRNRAVAQPEEFRDNISEELNDKAFKISELEEAAEGVPTGIEWSLFSKHDPAPLQALAAKSKQQPLPTTSSKVSDFQKHIREAKANILDPVFSTWNLSFNPVLESDDGENDAPPVDPAALKKAKEREKIMELKKNQIKPSGLTLTPTGHRTRGPGGVFIRRDLVDESMEVDISLENPEANQKPAEPSATAPYPSTPPQPPSSSPTKTSRIRQSIAKACANTSSFVRSPSIKIAPPSAPTPSTTRHRRRSSRTASSCADDMDVDDSTFPPTPDSLSFAELEPDEELDVPEQCLPHEQDDDAPKVLGKRTRPKSETYKQAWSTSEQQLLEALLEEIPEGEKNRWKKISKAMNGRRTPRQVASRVQKYFEKLKKFGID